MYIRRTTIKSRQTGEPYYTYRLVESIREGGRVRQRTLLNLGRHFGVPREQWGALVQRIEHLVAGQQDLIPAYLDAQWEEAAQRYAAQLIRTRASVEEGGAHEGTDYHTVDVDTLELLRPRSVGIEHVALAALRQVGLDRQLQALGFNGPQQAAAIGTLVARMSAPGSELATHHWLQNHSALGELIDYDFLGMEFKALYRISDQLLKHKAALEGFLFAAGSADRAPTVVLDAGIATEGNIAWLVAKGYRYLVVSRKRHREFDPDGAVLIKEDGDLTIRAQRRGNADTGEVELYCHSSEREKKDRGIAELFARRFEAALAKLAAGLHKKGTVKRYEKVLERLRRLREKYARAAQYYDVTVEQDTATGKATAITWQRIKPIAETLPGVYCLRTNEADWDDATLWRTCPRCSPTWRRSSAL